MSDAYYRDRDNVDNNTRGRIFENGCARFFRDHENGYVQQSRIYETREGRVQFDHIKEYRDQLFTIEDKSGRIDGKKDERQLRALGELLRDNGEHKHILTRN